jgi:peptidoglycan hydrolase CwlO-like protein
MNYEILLTNASFATLAVGVMTAILSALGGWLAARAGKAPDVQSSITAAVAGIMTHYQSALDLSSKQVAALAAEIDGLHRTIEAQTATIAGLQATVEGQTETISTLESHIDELTAAMRASGVTPPPRRARARRVA